MEQTKLDEQIKVKEKTKEETKEIVETKEQIVEKFKQKVEQEEVITEDKIRLLRMMFPSLKDVRDEEIIKAFMLARHLKLDPFKKEVHLVPYKGSVQLIVNYLEYIKRAERTNKLNGWKVEFTPDGKVVRVTIYRKDWEHPFVWDVYIDEINKKETNPLWRIMPKFMARKVAIAQAFRLAFPEEITKLTYTEEEIEILENEEVEKTKENSQKN